MQPRIVSIPAARRTCVPKELIFGCRDRATDVRSRTKTPKRKYLSSIQYVCRRLRFFSRIWATEVITPPMFYNRLRVCACRLHGRSDYYILSLLAGNFRGFPLPTWRIPSHFLPRPHTTYRDCSSTEYLSLYERRRNPFQIVWEEKNWLGEDCLGNPRFEWF